MANGSFKANSAAFAAMAVGPEVAAIVLEIAADGLQIAEALAQPFRETGDYATSFRVRPDVAMLRVARFGSHPVAVGVLENTSVHAAAVEWGNADDHRAHHVLARTIDELGGIARLPGGPGDVMSNG